MQKEKVHIVGAGLAGMSTAAFLRSMGFKGQIVIYEAAADLGGRTSSFFVAELGRYVDNGTHLVLKANKYLLAFLKLIRAERTLVPAHINLVFKKKSLRELWRLAVVSVLNTNPRKASLLLMFKTLIKAMRNPKPLLVKKSLSDTFVQPFKTFAVRNNIRILRRKKCDGYRDGVLHFGNAKVRVGENEALVWAVPAANFKHIFPELALPSYSTIANVHFLLEGLERRPRFMTGVVGGAGHWYAGKGDILSVTISNKPELSDEEVKTVWQEARRLFHIPVKSASYTVIKMKRATIKQDRANLAKRGLALKILADKGQLVAGDWTIKGLPCTMEAAVFSGWRAAKTILAAKE